MTLNVLVLENEPDLAATAIEELQRAGHNVLQCHEPGTAAFPCRGVVDPSTCPLRSHDVDVALAVRFGTRAQPTLGEDGARCALVHRIPLVVAGAPFFDPFDEFATRTIDSIYDVVAPCEEAAGAPLVEAARRASAALASTAAHGARVEVTRRDGRLVAHLSDLEGLTPQECSRAAVCVVGALREGDPFVSGIDVAIDS